MNSKVSTALEKALQDKAKGNYHKALSRINEALVKHPDEVELYLEAADVSLEGGESLQATQFLKKALTKFSGERDRLDTFAREKLRNMGDPVLGKFLLDQAIKQRNLEWASELLEDLQDRTIRELLQRNRTKKQTLHSAAHGGHALKSELVVNVLSEALLCMRLGRMKAAVQSFIEILDDKPVENEVLEPFFAGLEKKHPKAARIRFAYACSLIYAQQYDKAMSRLVQGVQLEPKIADEALERLRNLIERFETPPESVQIALVEILLAKGDVLRAGELLRESLTDHPEQSKRVMELMRPHVEEISDSLVLHYLYMDAALLADQTRRVLEKLNAIRQCKEHFKDLYQWLENKSSEQFLPADIMIVHGQMALDKKDAERAIEILKAVLVSSPNDVHTVLGMLEKHKNDNQKIAVFYEEQAEKQRSDTPQHSNDGSEFEHFENKEFTFSGGSKEEPQIEPEDGEEAGNKSVPAQEMVKPVELDPGPFGGGSDEKEDNGFEAEDGGDKQKSPLELGLEMAAESAIKDHSADIVWEEETGDGEMDRTADRQSSESQEEDSWLELQSDSVMSDGATEAGEMNAAQDQITPEPDAPAPQVEDAETQVVEEPEATAQAEDPVADDSTQETVERVEVTETNDVPEEPQPEEHQSEELPSEEPQSDEPRPEEPAYEISEQHVLNLAEALRDAGARLFFYVQTDDAEQSQEQSSQDLRPKEPQPEDGPGEATSSQRTREPDPVPEEGEVIEDNDLPEAVDEMDVDVDVTVDTPIASEPKSLDPFEAQFERFLDGKLDNDAILDLASTALESGKNDEARELLYFEPKTDAERSARSRCLVDYHMATNKPSAALNLIESIANTSLADEDRRHILMKKASCHNIMNDLESAQAVYEIISSEFPSEESDKMAKLNSERFKKHQESGALVLEKTTSLQDD